MTKHVFADGLIDAARALEPKRLDFDPGQPRLALADDRTMIIDGPIGFYDCITGTTVAAKLRDLGAGDVTIRINSPGGVVHEGMAIYNRLAAHDGNIAFAIDGVAASIASVVIMSGDRIMIGEGANVMIHKPWTMMAGNADDLRKEAEVLDTLEAGISTVYAARTGKAEGDLRRMMADETWFLGQQAVDEGFADEIIPAKRRAALQSGLYALYRHTPAALVASVDGVQLPTTIREFEAFLREKGGFSHAEARRMAESGWGAQKPSPRDEAGVRAIDELLRAAQSVAAATA